MIFPNLVFPVVVFEFSAEYACKHGERLPFLRLLSCRMSINVFSCWENLDLVRGSEAIKTLMSEWPCVSQDYFILKAGVFRIK